jgi:flavin reductase (DIM6/NTAB) family NADH-FMN oxidoreductase RutF
MRKNFGAKPLFYPMPVLIVAAYDENGTPNAMNAAWGGVYDDDMIVLCLSQGHKTTKDIFASKALTISFADAAHVIQADYLGVVSGNKVPDKLQKAGLTTSKSSFVNAPIINEFPVCMECELAGTTENGNIIAKIVNVSVDEDYVLENGNIDALKAAFISYNASGNTYLALSKEVGHAFQDGLSLK